jgi:hypothetical protein
MVNPIDAFNRPNPESELVAAFGGGERGAFAVELLKYVPSKENKYPVDELMAKMERTGLDVNGLAACSEETRLLCGLLVRKITDIINQTSNPSKFLGLGDQTEEAIEMMRSSQ